MATIGLTAVWGHVPLPSTLTPRRHLSVRRKPAAPLRLHMPNQPSEQRQPGPVSDDVGVHGQQKHAAFVPSAVKLRDDAVYFNMLRFAGLRPYTPPSAVEEIFTAEFEGAWEEKGMFLLTMHPHIIGHRSRMPLLARLIAHMKAKGGCWFATHAQVAEWCRDHG